MFSTKSILLSAIMRVQLECARYIAAGSVPECLVIEIAEIAVVLSQMEPSAPS